MWIGVDFSITNIGFALMDSKLKGIGLIQTVKSKKPAEFKTDKDSFCIYASYRKGDMRGFIMVFREVFNLIRCKFDDNFEVFFERTALIRKGTEEFFTFKGILKCMFLETFNVDKIKEIDAIRARNLVFNNPQIEKPQIYNRMRKIMGTSWKFLRFYKQEDREHILDAIVILLAEQKRIKGWDFDASSFF